MALEVRLSREMRLIDVTMIGVGAMIGAGIFVLTGIAAGVAGPALLLVFLLNGLVALLTAMAYAELGQRDPRRRRRLPLDQALAARPERLPGRLDGLVRARRRLLALRPRLRRLLQGGARRRRRPGPARSPCAPLEIWLAVGACVAVRVHQLPGRLGDRQGRQRRHRSARSSIIGVFIVGRAVGDGRSVPAGRAPSRRS